MRREATGRRPGGIHAIHQLVDPDWGCPVKCQHTPGPWFINDAKTAIMAHGGGTSVAYHPALPWESLEAPTVSGAELVRRMIKESHCNAQLMAAAPELLAALEVVLSSTCGNVGDDGYEGCIKIEAKALDRARAAIAKAKGL